MQSPAAPELRKLEYLAPSALKKSPRNARTHSDKQVAQIARSIRRFGFTNPILIDDENVILAGHGRILAAELERLEEVPCVRLSHLNEPEMGR